MPSVTSLLRRPASRGPDRRVEPHHAAQALAAAAHGHPAAAPHVGPVHRDVSGGWLRPAVFGAMDGLVSNVSLLAGVAGGSADHAQTVLAGTATLVAGAFSMATGEYTSVRSQNEAMAAEIAVERHELSRSPRAEAAELAGVFRMRGVDADLADEVARQISRDPEVALRVHAQEELGVDPDNLPDPWVAAGSSFGSFAGGALIPLLPYLLGARRLYVTLLVSALALLVGGLGLSQITGRPKAYSAARQVLLGAVAVSATYVVGRLVGSHVG